MKKLILDTLTEHGEYSIKRILAMWFSIIASYLSIKIVYFDSPVEGHLYLLGELLGFIGLLLGLAVANKHKALSKSTNSGRHN